MKRENVKRNKTKIRLVIAGKARSKRAKSASQFEEHIRKIARSATCGKLWLGDLRLDIHYFHRGRSRPDLDNVVKTIFDGLKAGLYKDDNQINGYSIQAYDLDKGFTMDNVKEEWILDYLGEPGERVLIQGEKHQT